MCSQKPSPTGEPPPAPQSPGSFSPPLTACSRLPELLPGTSRSQSRPVRSSGARPAQGGRQAPPPGGRQKLEGNFQSLRPTEIPGPETRALAFPQFCGYELKTAPKNAHEPGRCSAALPISYLRGSRGTGFKWCGHPKPCLQRSGCAGRPLLLSSRKRKGIKKACITPAATLRAQSMGISGPDKAPPLIWGRVLPLLMLE